MHGNIIKNCKFQQEITVTNGAAGTSDITGSIIDMEGYEGCVFILQLGAITSGAVTSCYLKQSADSGLSGATSLTTATTVTIADTDDEKVIVIDVYRPTKRYIALFVDRGTQNAVVSAVAMQYGARQAPVTQGTGIHASSLLAVSPTA